MLNQTLKRALVFFVIAFAISFLFNKIPPIKIFEVAINDLLCGFGPLLSGLTCYQLFKTPTNFSLTGSQPIKVWSVTLLTALAFVFSNHKTGIGYNMLFAITQIIYCLGEEFGWRHYLQSETRQLNKWLQALIIGTVWFGWHFSWLQYPLKAMLGSNFNAPLPAGIAAGILSLILFSMLLGWLIQKTNALLIPVLIHFVIKTNSTTLLVTALLITATVITWDKINLDNSSPKTAANT